MLNSTAAKAVGGFFLAMMAGLVAIGVSGKPLDPQNGNQNRYTAQNPKTSPEKDTQIVEKVEYKDTPIPQEYIQALQFVNSLKSSPYLTRSNIMFGLKSFRVNVELEPKIRDLIDFDVIKARLEVRLRQIGVKIDANSPYGIGLAIDGFSSGNIVSYTLSLDVYETVYVFRGSNCYKTSTAVWRIGWYGRGSSQGLTQQVSECVEHVSDRFGCDFLGANQ